MKFLIGWIAEYTELPDDDQAVARAFTLSGSEVEGWETVQGETVLDFGITVNRPDCMNVFGLAREGSALFGGELRPPASACIEKGPPIRESTSVTIEAPDLCPRYRARLIRGVRVGDSPAWMQRRLIQCGLRPINAVVDVTNYVLLDLGHPLHAFDFNTLRGGRIVVRRARPGERIMTLDGVERTLSPEMLVIADAERPVAVAGVMGDEETGVTRETTDVLLEGAVFDAVSVRKTSKSLGMHTDASHRFERGVDSEGPVVAIDRAARLIVEICGGQLAWGAEDAHPGPRPPVEVDLRFGRVSSLLGIEVPEERCVRILEHLGFEISGTGGGSCTVRVPTHRVDVGREVDLIEEIARMVGMEGLPSTLPAIVDPEAGRSPAQRLEDSLRDSFAAAGFSEAIHMSMTDPLMDEAFGSGDRPLLIRNPLGEGSSVLRTRLASSLVGAVRKNRSHGHRHMALFEVGRAYIPRGEGLPLEEDRLAAALYTDDPSPKWGDRFVPGVLRLKGVFQNALSAAGLRVRFRKEDHPQHAPGHSVAVEIGGEKIGSIGTVRPDLLESISISSGTICLAEIRLDGLAEKGSLPGFKPVSRLPSVGRDFSFLLPASVTWEDLEGTLMELDLPNLESLHLVDVYEGKGIPADKRSWTFNLVFRSVEKTLTDEELSPIALRVTTHLKERFDAIQR